MKIYGIPFLTVLWIAVLCKRFAVDEACAMTFVIVLLMLTKQVKPL